MTTSSRQIPPAIHPARSYWKPTWRRRLVEVPGEKFRGRAHKGRGLNESFTVRRISYGEGVERVFPINSPRIEKVEVEREGQDRRAKLFYLRGRKGKEALFVKERVSATIAKKAKSSATKAKAAEAAA